MGGNRPDRHAASIKASSIPPQAAEPCPIHDLGAVTAGRASACAKYGLTTVIKGSPRTVCGNPINGMGLKARIGKRPPYRLLRKAGRFVRRGERTSVQRSPKPEELRKHRRPARPRRLQGFKHECGSTFAWNKTVTGLVKGSGRFRWHGVPAERVGFGIPEHPAAGKAGIPA